MYELKESATRSLLTFFNLLKIILMEEAEEKCAGMEKKEEVMKEEEAI